jgi:hypothetical protein
MKKVYTLIFSLLSAGAISQNLSPAIPFNGITTTVYPKNFSTAAAGDTLGLAEFAPGGQVVNYGFQGGGYIFGVNAASFDQQGTTIWQAGTGCARGFILDQPSQISGALVLFANKTAGANSATSKIVAKVVDIASNLALASNTSQAADTIGPKSTALATAEVTLADADTANYTFFPFATPANVTEDFAVTLDYSSCLINQDTISVLADQDGDGGGVGYTWGRLSFWISTISGNPVQAAWAYPAAFLQDPLDVNLAIFAIVGGNTSINDQNFFDGLKLGQNYPNPTKDNAKIDFELINAASKVTFKVIDLNGRVLSTHDLGARSGGRHSFDLSVESLSAGTYFYMLTADGHNLVKQMSIAK